MFNFNTNKIGAGGTAASNGQLITLTASTTLAATPHAGVTLLMGAAGAALTFTLPEATGTGDVYSFVVSVVNTSNYLIVVTTTDTMDGSILSLQDSADTVTGWEADGTDDTITLNATTTGGVAIGNWVSLQDIADTQWSVTGVTTSSGTEATPFSAAQS